MTSDSGGRDHVYVSVVIPTFNSAAFLARTVAELEEFLKDQVRDYEVVIVDDGSSDNTWERVLALRLQYPSVRGVRLLRNSGQHSAVLAGLRETVGDRVVVMDDDGQHPPQEICTLLLAANQGHDLVFGLPEDRKHNRIRNMGSATINWLTTPVFGKPRSVHIASFKLMTRDVVDRICQFASTDPYINGEALLFSGSPATVLVEHRARQSGKSNYNPTRLFRLVLRILIGYSTFPLRFASVLGLLAGALGLVYGIFILVRALILGTGVPGWTTLVVLVSFMQSIILLGVAFVGEYSARSLRQAQSHPAYIVVEQAE